MDRALEELMTQQVGSPATWTVAGNAPLDLFVDGVPSMYEGFVFEQVFTHDSIPAACSGSDRMTVTAWRPFPDSTGINAVGAWAPAMPRPEEFPLGYPMVCGGALGSLEASASAWSGDIGGRPPRYSPISYMSRLGSIQYDREGLAHGKPCAQPPKGWPQWEPGTCLAFTYRVKMTAIMARRTKSAGVGDGTVISFTARLPGIRVTQDCRSHGPLAYACFRGRTPFPCGRGTVRSDGSWPVIHCAPPTPQEDAQREP